MHIPKRAKYRLLGGYATAPQTKPRRADQTATTIRDMADEQKEPRR